MEFGLCLVPGPGSGTDCDLKITKKKIFCKLAFPTIEKNFLTVRECCMLWSDLVFSLMSDLVRIARVPAMLICGPVPMFGMIS
jgi:hypothetical protein